MTDNVDDLILDLLEWLGPHPRPYSDVLDAWRTSCPRLPVWEEANTRSLLERSHAPGQGQFVSVSTAGTEYLWACRRQRADVIEREAMGQGRIHSMTADSAGA
jgi:hypothetical protein